MQVLITFKDAVQELETTIADVGGTVIKQFTIAPIVLADIPKNMLTVLEINPLVKAVEVDKPDAVKICDASIEVVNPNVSWGANQIHAPEANSLGMLGQGVKIAIIDTGIDYRHPDLVSSYAGGYDFVSKDADPMDDNSHGTHCAGIIASVAPAASLFAVKALNASGSASWSDIISAYEWCVTNNMDIVSNSYGGPNGTIAIEAALTAMVNSGIIAVFAAGNSGPSGGVNYPGAYSVALAVGATDDHDTVANFSSRGPQLCVVAPGVNINSTVLAGQYGLKSGTSMATPYVAGTLALGLSNGFLANELRARLTRTANPLGANVDYGAGRINALTFITDTAPPPAPGPIGPSVRPIVTFDASGSVDTDGQIVSYVWNFGDGQTSTGSNVQHTYAAFGWFTVTLTVTDNLGANNTSTRELLVVPNQPPVLQFTAVHDPITREAPCTVVFNASASYDPEGDDIISYEWRFGNGQTGSGPIVTTTYTVPGNPIIAVTLTDSQGGSQTYYTATVILPPTGPTNLPPIASFTINGN